MLLLHANIPKPRVPTGDVVHAVLQRGHRPLFLSCDSGHSFPGRFETPRLLISFTRILSLDFFVIQTLIVSAAKMPQKFYVTYNEVSPA